MAVLFDSALSTSRTSQILSKFGSSGSGHSVIGILYSGTQPSLADYTTNWGTNYYWNSSNHAVGSNVLGLYGDIDTTGTESNLLRLNYSGSAGSNRYLEFTDPACLKTWKANGTASWMAILTNTNNSTYVNGYTSTAFYSHGYFMLAPVTNSSGTGIVKLDSTTVSGGTLPDIADVSLIIT